MTAYYPEILIVNISLNFRIPLIDLCSLCNEEAKALVSFPLSSSAGGVKLQQP